MKLLRAIGTGLLVGLIAMPMSATSETLASALASAYANSGLLDQNRALLRAADEDVAQAASALMPIVNWSASAKIIRPVTSSVDTESITIQIVGELLLYDFGVSRLAVEAQKEVVLATRQSLIGVEQQVLQRAVNAYMNYLRDSEFVRLRESNVRVITQELRASQDRFEVGAITRTDVAVAEARLAAARSLLAVAQGSLARSAAEYLAVTGHAPSGIGSVSPAPIARAAGDAVALAFQRHPDMLEMQHNVTAAELLVRRAEASLYPSVTLNGIGGVDDEGSAAAQFSLNVGGPIYQGGRLSSLIRQSIARRDAARAGLHMVSASVEQNVAIAYANLAVAVAGSEASQRQVDAALVAFEGVREEANLGARTTLDVLNAEQELLDARTSLISAQVDQVMASYGVLAATGLLTAEHLGLPVQTYDPEAYYNLVEHAPIARSEQGRALDRVLQAIGQ